jgi:Serine/threonine protein kinase
MTFGEENRNNPMIGSRIGVYLLKEEIGRGGMGAVYRADRADGEFYQTVAVKLIKRGMDTDLILKRFRRERQILAALDHPNIAYFLGGGSTDDGLPYFVMEFIEGRQLYTYCNEKKLDTAQRLMIFREVCFAVNAAHQLKVIHRDLKPSNILVKSDGRTKLLDFGIAKVLDPELMATEIEPTAAQMQAMTPEYASPEQIGGETVDRASDIYSLGVILYELLTGHRPYSLPYRSPHEAARIIREEEPTDPSASVTQDENLMPAAASEKPFLEVILQSRNSSLESLRRELEGDLDRIILKTLRKNPAERYQTAAALADDITNYLAARPVKAEVFHSRRSVTRSIARNDFSVAVLPFRILNKTAIGDTGDEFLGIGLADALISRLSGVQRLIIRPTSSVLPFADAEPFEAGRSLGVDFVLDGSIRAVGDRIRISVQLLNVGENSTRWAKVFDHDLTDVLDLENSLSEEVATSLLSQLTIEERRKLEIRLTSNPQAYEAYLRGRYFWSRFTGEHLVKAMDAFKEAIELDPEFALPYVGLADLYTWMSVFGDIPSHEGFPKAQGAARRALEIDGTFGEAYAVLAFSTLVYDWNWPEAEFVVQRALELNPNSSFAHECYSNFLSTQGRFDEAIVEIKKSEELDPISPRAILMTAWTLYQTGNFQESIAKARKTLEMQEGFLQGLLHLGNALTAVGETAEAVSVLKESCKQWPENGMPRYMLCHALAADGQMSEARVVLDELLHYSEQNYFKPYYVAMAYVAVGEIDKAFDWFEKSLAGRNEFLVWFGTEPKLEALRDHPRYLAILKGTNNPIVANRRSHETLTTGDCEKSIAVLPFKLIGGQNINDPESNYLGIGLADALTMRLSNVRRFLVRPTSSVLPFAEADDSFAAARQLRVDFIVDGNIRRVGGRIRVTAQLLDVNEGGTRWAVSFDENFSDVLQMEDSISEKVAKCLVPQLTGEEERRLAKRGTNKVSAHEQYLQGRYFWNQFTPDAFAKAFSAFQRAVEIDPDYALAYAGIADFYTWSCIYGLISPSEAFPNVYSAATRALELDESLAEPRAAISLYIQNILWDWEATEASYKKVIEIDPNYSLGHEWYAATLVGMGRYEEALREILIAERLDPLSLRAKVLTAWTTYQTGDLELSVAKSREMIQLDPNFTQGYLQLSNGLLETGQAKEALEACSIAVRFAPDWDLPVYLHCFALAANGRLGDARDVLNDLKRRSAGRYVSPYFLGMGHIALGEVEQAFDYFQKAFDEHNPWIIWFASEPKLDLIHDDPRFIKLLKQYKSPIVKQLEAEKTAI